MNVRALAAKTLAPVLQRKTSLTAGFDRNLATLEDKDKPLFQQLCFGVLRQFFELESISQQLLSKPLKDKDSDILALILIGIYQLKHLRVPDHAAISETVNGAKKLKKMWATKLVNPATAPPMTPYLRGK